MYVDCPTCNYEQDVVLIGTSLKEQSKQHGFKIREDGSLECPNGHDAYLYPTMIKFWKRYKWPKLKNEK